MNVPILLQRHPSLRLALPAGVLTVAALAASGLFTAHSAPHVLPTTTPAALMAAVRSPSVTGFSGTVLSRVSLGLPEIPTLGTSSTASIGTLLTGSHTLQVWYGGPDEQRIALLGVTDETDLFRSGRRVWEWSSADRVAQRALLPKQVGSRSSVSPTVAPVPSSSDTSTLTPTGLAQSLLAALDPTTKVTVQRSRTVADRAAYELVLTPRTSGTLIGSVHITVDGATKIPLEVRVFPRGSRFAAVDVAYTSIRMSRPADTYFHFSPPSGATVRALAGTLNRQTTALTGGRAPKITGSGWTRVISLDASASIRKGSLHRAGLTAAMTRVAGRWGHGHLLETSLLDVLVTSGGRIFAGAVEPSALYAAASTR